MIQKLRVGIIGSGPGGLGLALALQQANINVNVYEKDVSFESRKQGYGLTLQQGQKALNRFNLREELTNRDTPSSSHYIFDSNGNLLGFFGPKFHLNQDEQKAQRKRKKRHNIHTPRQELRRLLLEQLHPGTIKWNKKLIKFNESDNEVVLEFDDGKEEVCHLLVGCDGIFSTVRKQYFKNGNVEDKLNYLGVLVVLGITECSHELVYRRIWQTIDGNTRLFAMPFTEKGPYSNKDTVMWQLSFPMEEKTAKFLSQNHDKLREELNNRCGNWHEPIPDMLKSTKTHLLSATPVYDREPLRNEDFKYFHRVALLGDAAHPMSPFKGQGANQALLDAVLLVDKLLEQMNSDEQDENLVRIAIRNYTNEMTQRSISKVLGSREMVVKHHSPFTESTLVKRGVNIKHVEYLRALNINPSTKNIDQVVIKALHDYEHRKKL